MFHRHSHDHRDRRHARHERGGDGHEHRGGPPWRGGGRRGGRVLDHGDLRLLALQLLQEKPRHGYEIIKAIEERLGRRLQPEPGRGLPDPDPARGAGLRDGRGQRRRPQAVRGHRRGHGLARGQPPCARSCRGPHRPCPRRLRRRPAAAAAARGREPEAGVAPARRRAAASPRRRSTRSPPPSTPPRPRSNAPEPRGDETHADIASQRPHRHGQPLPAAAVQALRPQAAGQPRRAAGPDRVLDRHLHAGGGPRTC